MEEREDNLEAWKQWIHYQNVKLQSLVAKAIDENQEVQEFMVQLERAGVGIKIEYSISPIMVFDQNLKPPQVAPIDVDNIISDEEFDRFISKGIM